MSNNKMLIDASHREETRVVVLRGNRIEEFDFEAQERRQLRGNIYLAKVTRVEPSLQAAFIDYGGNRHGFLAFSEIHPDYYQIPAADRQALLEKEAQDASDDVAAEEAEVAQSVDQPEEKPAKRRRSRRSRKPRAGDKDASSANLQQEENKDAEADNDAVADETSADKSADADNSDSEVENNGDDGEENGRTMAAAMAIDSISEDAPDDGDDIAGEDPNSEDAPKKRVTKRAPRKKAATKTKKKVTKAEIATEATGDDTAIVTQADADLAPEIEEKPKKKPAARKPRKTSRKKAKPVEDEEQIATEQSDADTKNAESVLEAVEVETDENGDPIENVGQEDAMEEVPQRRKPIRQYKIQEVIRRRQVLLVQVVKEERGNKGAALTTYMSLAGRYSVLMPNTARGGGISRKITNPADRKRLKEIASGLEVPKGMGVILRTAGASRTTPEIKRDFEYLMRLWENVRNLTLASSAPFLVYEEGSLIKRSIRDLYHKDIGEIIVSGEEGFREAKEFMQMLEPSQAKNVKQHTGEQPILSKHGVEAQLEKMLAPQVTLKSGGYLVINQTEALVAIDVNSGRSTREHSIEATALQTNLEAAEEVARQLRLRDLAGLIVIDFIDMEENRNNRAVEKRMKECLKNDRARIQVGHISHFGLMEMSRQRIRASVLESTMEVCPHCQGIGHIRSRSSFAIQIMRALGEHLNRQSRNDLIVKTSGDSALYILNNQRIALNDLEERFGVKIVFESDQSLDGQNYTIENGPVATGEAKPRAAVNPMDFGEEPDEDNAAVLEATNTDEATSENEEDAGGSKRRRRRRGGRGRSRDNNGGGRTSKNADQATQSVVTETGDKEDVKADVSTTKEVSDEPDVKARKSGRGRKRLTESKKSEEASTEATAELIAQDSSSATPVTSQSDISDVDDAPRKVRRSTGRPGKKAASKDAETAPEAEIKATDAVETEESVDKSADAGEAEKPDAHTTRRNTRRVKTKKLDAETSSEDANEPAEENTDKKKSWWGKGSFFG